LRESLWTYTLRPLLTNLVQPSIGRPRGRHRYAHLLADQLLGSQLGDDYPELAICALCGHAVRWPNGVPSLGGIGRLRPRRDPLWRELGFVMAVTRRVRVLPAYHQMEIRDAADGVDRPLWETGEERVLASAQCIVLATRSDLDGEVEIEVRVGAGLDDQAGGQLLFDGELLTTGQGILVGNSLTDLHRVGLPIGWHLIRIYAEPPTDPARFTVLLDPRPASD
jgi:hypothetical protein